MPPRRVARELEGPAAPEELTAPTPRPAAALDLLRAGEIVARDAVLARRSAAKNGAPVRRARAQAVAPTREPGMPGATWGATAARGCRGAAPARARCRARPGADRPAACAMSMPVVRGMPWLALYRSRSCWSAASAALSASDSVGLRSRICAAASAALSCWPETKSAWRGEVTGVAAAARLARLLGARPEASSPCAVGAVAELVLKSAAEVRADIGPVLRRVALRDRVELLLIGGRQRRAPSLIGRLRRCPAVADGAGPPSPRAGGMGPTCGRPLAAGPAATCRGAGAGGVFCCCRYVARSARSASVPMPAERRFSAARLSASEISGEPPAGGVCMTGPPATGWPAAARWIASSVWSPPAWAGGG